ncbi:thiol-disulfide oxidoreductase DCC family protein [Acidipropionibacterium jensenii]|uniref:thiol-disulfide oxidoreductase DCC family protein n=1 Tax=Acidipropionibacterium jensenii TaxID=1749 RepID=UPI00214B83FD|nr:DUF393 domain-containing protein [Acidipropionibacterium jensenii]
MTLTSPPPQGVLLYDPDCGFCTRVAGALQQILAAGRGQAAGDATAHPTAAVIPMTEADLDALGVDAARARCEIPLVLGDGTVVWAAAAIGQALEGAKAPWSWLGRIITAPLIAPLAGRIYAWVAANRYRLPGGSESCRL